MSDDRKHTKTQLVPGLFFSPGFYAGYWDNCILPNFSPEIIESHVKLTKHREVWVGSILAAAQTKAHGERHFVGLPDDEPADIDLIRLKDVMAPSGKAGTSIQRLKVQVTRCNYDADETLLKQIEKKNRAAYKGIILAVYAYGDKSRADYSDVSRELHKIDEVFPSEIVVVEQTQKTEGGLIMLPGTYSVTKLFPENGQTTINVGDKDAFFIKPEVFSKTRLAFSVEWDDLGSLELMPPQIPKP